MGLHGAPSISRECDAVHASLEISIRKSWTSTSTLWWPEADMAQEPDSLAFRFAVVLALALIVLILATWTAPPILGTIRLRRSRIATRFTGLSI
jgi:hypothetical protein